MEKGRRVGDRRSVVASALLGATKGGTTTTINTSTFAPGFFYNTSTIEPHSFLLYFYN